MEFETVQIHFLSDVLGCWHPAILLSWQRDVTTSPLYFKHIHTLGSAVKLFIPRGKFASANQNDKPDPVSDTSSAWNFCICSSDVILQGNSQGDIAKCQLPSQANSSIKFPLSFAPANANDCSACMVRGVLHSL